MSVSCQAAPDGMVLNPVGIGSSLAEYHYRFGKNAFLIACQHGNHAIVAEFIMQGIQLTDAEFKQVKSYLKKEKRYDLMDLLQAFFEDSAITQDELIAVLRVFKSQDTRRDRYGTMVAPKRLSQGSKDFNLEVLSEELQEKIKNILSVTR